MKTKDILIALFISIVALGTLIVTNNISQNKKSQENQENKLSESFLVAEEKTFDFGTISMAKGPVSHEYVVTNTGARVSLVRTLYTSCMCTQAALKTEGGTFGPYGMPGHGFIPAINAAINPQEQSRVIVTFDPAAHGPAGVGKIERSIILENDSGAPVELRFTANVTP